MLAEVVSGSIEARHIVSPLRGFFGKVRFQNSKVEAIDLQRRMITASHCPRCARYELTYDHLVLALGSRTNFFGLPGVAEHAFPMKTLADALALRNHVIDVLEHADIERHLARRRPLCTVVVAGGGFAGVEAIAELNDFARRAQRFYLWRTIYLCKLPGLESTVRVALDWTLDLVFPRDITLLKTAVPLKADDSPERVPQPVDLAQDEWAPRSS